MEESKKKWLQQNPNSRSLLFIQLVLAINSCTEAVAMLMEQHRNRAGFLVVPYNRGLEDAVDINPIAAMTAPAIETPAKYFAEYLVTYRLALYGERNEWLEEWPSLVDLAGLPPLAQYPTRPPQTASNETADA